MGSKDQRMNDCSNLKWIWMLLCCLYFCASTSNAQSTDTVQVTAPQVAEEDSVDDVDEAVVEPEIIDTSLVVNNWMYPADSVRKLQRQKEFAYIKNLDSLLKARQDAYLKNQKEIEPVEQQEPANIFPFFRILLWGIAIFAVVFIVYRLFLSERGLFAAPTRNKKLSVEEDPVIDEAYLDQQLQDALRKNNYRLAIRYLYLQTLSKMADKGWLQLSPDKTNYQYVQELNKWKYKNEFARITLHYEYAWYGDFAIGEEVFKPVQQAFEQFHVKLKQS